MLETKGIKMILNEEKTFYFTDCGDHIKIEVSTKRDGAYKAEKVSNWKEVLLFLGAELDLDFLFLIDVP
jgi:hypothetical protein